ncbi:glycoside hydrolase family 31 protein [Paenibacillus glycanilyticus]|uniref:Alpha-glucosidase n=1 Tax=Paenibacillus glycanilyticus TaxID=126569 RepID=A0ABQ6G8F1_9BACL|nr:glycoside hydrolase family 31 protein [Paenibacillus glycanilyticus]GLX67239.1 alpha-glucosidase [Paenibacillus glycanilyticus]
MITKQRLTTAPIARSESILLGEKYRFTVLTSRLIRMEYNEQGKFEDLPSQTVINRDFATPAFEVYETEEYLEIQTSELLLKYDKKAFSGNGLSVHVNDISGRYMKTWHYGEVPKDLKGTARTLDDINGALPLEPGILSKEGYALLDDSKSLESTEDGWISPRLTQTIDLYFFGYGRDYWQALKDFYHLTGAMPLLPRFALGNWWSRYHPYSEQDYKTLMTEFKNKEIPFAVSVIDMDWHITKIDPKYGSGWTGYTWNKELFPDPQGFMGWLHDQNLKVTLNLHPADGVRPSEAMYPEMKAALGIEGERNPMIPFDFTDPTFADAYFKVLHHPYEEMGVDFWWIDWQQGAHSKVEGLDPLWMLNHYHYLDNAKHGKRPLTFSRYAGAGSHRYPIGFSGDTHATWESLQFQPYFTANASNIGYGWWSHDIGGHMYGYKDDEMVTRWIQFGVFSPINRLHSSDNVFSGKEPWNYAPPFEQAMEKFLRLRHRLIPYLYSMNKRAHEQGKPIVAPMYYNNPWNEDAYQVQNQYYFGTELIVAPITEPVERRSQVAEVSAWLPEGDWVDFFTGQIYSGNTRVTFYRGINEIPVLARMGSIVPLADLTTFTNAINNPSQLELRVFAGASGQFTMWEDHNNEQYGQESWLGTEYELAWQERPTFTIHPAQGELAVAPEYRDYRIVLVNVPQQQVTVTVNNELVEAEYQWSKQELTILLKNVRNTDMIQVTLEHNRVEERDKLKRVYDFLHRAQIEFNLKLELYNMICGEPNFSKVVRNLESRKLDAHIVGTIVEILGSTI